MNKELEIRYFEIFSECYPLPVGDVRHQEQPDVVVDGERKIGIELTNFYSKTGRCNDSKQRQKAAQIRVLKKAQEQYLKDGDNKLQLYVSFNDDYPITDEKYIQEELAKIAASIQNQPDGSVHPKNHKSLKEIFLIYILPRDGHFSEWQLSARKKGPGSIAAKLVACLGERASI